MLVLFEGESGPSDTLRFIEEKGGIRPNGRVRWILSRGEILVDAQGAPVRAIGIAFDVTHHHEQLKTLEISDARFQALVKTLRAAIWMAQPDGHVTASLNWTELTSEDPANFLGTGWIDSLHPDDRDRTLKTWANALAKKDAYEIEHRARVQDGSYHWYKSRAMPVLNDDGSVREWLGISYDITESKTWLRNPASGTLTGAQIRAARGVLNWSVRDLAEKAQVSGSTIRRLEETDGPVSPGEAAIAPMREALEKAGVEFLFPPSGKPGLRPV